MTANKSAAHTYKVTHLPPPEKPRAFGTQSAADLLDEVLPEINWIVPGMLPEGLTILSGKAKLGKSWLLLSTGIAVAMGGFVLGSIRVEAGDVLYLALEDNKRRLQKRLNKLLPTGARPERLNYETTCKGLEAGLVEDLRDWIESRKAPRLIIVDVLNRVRPAQRPGEMIYDYDVRCLVGLQGLAAEYGLAIVVVHHNRKAESEDPFDGLSGSTGLTGTADTTLILSRDGHGTTLYGRGRDLEELEWAVNFDKETGHWGLMGEAVEVRRSDERSAVLNLLRQTGTPMSVANMVADLGIKRNTLDVRLGVMVRAGDIERVEGKRGLYALPGYSYRAAQIAQKLRSPENGEE